MIVIGVASINPDYRFWPNFTLFFAANLHNDIRLKHVWRKMLHTAQTEIVEVALASKASHILFVEDDMSFIPNNGLDLLLEADVDVITCVTYSRPWPHYVIPLRKRLRNSRLSEFNEMCREKGLLIPIGEDEEGIVEVDLTPQCFTLCKIDIFRRMELPWFKFGEVGATDCWFSDRCADAGIKMHAHMGVRVEHAGINSITRPFYFEMGKKERLKEIESAT